MESLSIDICWSLAEAEAAHAGFNEIGVAHFWVGVCKAVDISVAALLKAGSPEHRTVEGQVNGDFLEVLTAFSRAGLSPKLLRRAIRAEVGKRSGNPARPLHRSSASREAFKHGNALSVTDGGRLRPAHLVVALIEQWDPAVSSVMAKLGHDSFEMLNRLRGHLKRAFVVPPQGNDRIAEEKKEGKESALRRFGRDLTELGALSDLQGRFLPELQVEVAEGS